MYRTLASTVRGAVNEAWGLATAVVLYPLGVRSSALSAFDDPEALDHLDAPIVQIHGYFHNRSGFFFMARALRKQGFRWVYQMNYNPLGESIPSLAQRLGRHVQEVLRVSGAPRAHLIGHSLGGLVARWYVQELGGSRFVDHCVTIGTPHAGTYAAYLGFGQTAVEMRPGSDVVTRLALSLPRCPTPFVNLHSDLDALIVPASAGVLPASDRIHNHLIRDLGHTSLLISSDVIGVVGEHLCRPDVRAPLAEVRDMRGPRAGAQAAEQ